METKHLQIQRLEGFYRVARAGGYARAARSFPYPITQPGVHQQVRKLEGELGCVLFTRAAKDQVILTAAGRVLLEFVTPFFEGLPAVVRSLRSRSHGGTLRIHAAGLVLRHLLPGWVRRLQAGRRDITVALSEMKTADPNLLRSGETDLLVDHLPEIPADVETRVVGKVRAFIVVPASHPLARRPGLRLRDLRDQAFISYNTERWHRELQLRALALHHASPARLLSVDSSETILAFVAAGLGFSLVPWLSAEGPRLAGVTAHPLTRPTAEFPVVAAWRRSALSDPLVEAALAALPPTG
jgi:DNA-binding transcriptional LysR family regulator